MRAVHRLRFQPTAHSARVTRIDRYLGRDDHAGRGSWSPAPGSAELNGVEISLVDTSAATGDVTPRDAAATIWHVLWVREETTAQVSIGSSTWPIAPGDSVIVPPKTSFRAIGAQLAFSITVPDDDAKAEPPTHGEEHFFGYNRQTICCRVGGIRLCRWKLTQPLVLAERHPGPVLTLALARDSTLRTSTEIDHLRQGELAVLNPAAHPIVSPDGLSYLLTIDRARSST